MSISWCEREIVWYYWINVSSADAPEKTLLNRYISVTYWGKTVTKYFFKAFMRVGRNDVDLFWQLRANLLNCAAIIHSDYELTEIPRFNQAMLI